MRLAGTSLKPYINHKALLGNTLPPKCPEGTLPSSLHPHQSACSWTALLTISMQCEIRGPWAQWRPCHPSVPGSVKWWSHHVYDISSLTAEMGCHIPFPPPQSLVGIFWCPEFAFETLDSGKIWLQCSSACSDKILCVLKAHSNSKTNSWGQQGAGWQCVKINSPVNDFQETHHSEPAAYCLVIYTDLWCQSVTCSHHFRSLKKKKEKGIFLELHDILPLAPQQVLPEM